MFYVYIPCSLSVCWVSFCPFLMVLVGRYLTCFGGWLDSFSLVASLYGVYLKVGRGVGMSVPGLEHLRAGGGGGGVV